MKIAGNVVTRARVEGLVILVVALGYLWETKRIPSLYQMPGVPGPTAFPTIVGLALAGAGLWRLLMRASRQEAPEPQDERPSGAGSPEGPARGVASWLSRSWRFYAMWAVIVAYLVLMPAVGFPLATVLGLAALFGLLGERRLPVTAGLSVAATVVMYFGFAKGLGVALPLGILEQLLK